MTNLKGGYQIVDITSLIKKLMNGKTTSPNTFNLYDDYPELYEEYTGYLKNNKPVLVTFDFGDKPLKRGNAQLYKACKIIGITNTNFDSLPLMFSKSSGPDTTSISLSGFSSIVVTGLF